MKNKIWNTVLSFAFIVCCAIVVHLVYDNFQAFYDSRKTFRAEYIGTAIWTKEVRQGGIFKIKRLISEEPTGCIVHITRWLSPVEFPSRKIPLESSARPAIKTLTFSTGKSIIPEDLLDGYYIYNARLDYECVSILDRYFGQATTTAPPILIRVDHNSPLDPTIEISKK